jgi:hypothetical protein
MMTYSWLRKEGCDNLQLSRDLVTFVILHATMTWNIARGKINWFIDSGDSFTGIMRGVTEAPTFDSWKSAASMRTM